MNKDQIQIQNITLPLYTCNTVIVGSGAAGYNAADTLHSLGQTDIVMVTNGINRGTSRNTGSDKQTYYKLSLAGNRLDSPYAMAKDLFCGGCVDGDIALCEASLSTKCFYKLCSIGVDFPQNQYGEYIGYQTDHDTAGRATSVGPLTSHIMTNRLQKQVEQKSIPVLDGHQVIGILTHNKQAEGLLCYTPTAQHPFALFHCKNIVYATGGPGGLYAQSVYPESQMGATGVALEAGVQGRNVTEWQFGIASIFPRWNVSGTYMQVLPQMYAVDVNGNRYDFLTDYFGDYGKALSFLFQKGYQWPFDVRKLDGSSIIDLLVYEQSTVKNRKVYLDFSKNPMGKPLDISLLSQEAATYLKNAGADFGTPVERLIHMNQPAYQLFLNKGIDLKNQPLEIAVCAQHNNGGLEIDHWWQSNIQGFFPCGEVAGSHGVFRPGGSALNAGQVGSTRAATYIAEKRKGIPKNKDDFLTNHHSAILRKLQLTALNNPKGETPAQLLAQLQNKMSEVAGIVRNSGALQSVLDVIKKNLDNFQTLFRINNSQDIGMMYQYYDLLLCAKGYVTAMLEFSKHGVSRGSALYPCETGINSLDVPFTCNYSLETDEYTDKIQEILYNPTSREFECYYRNVRPIPKDETPFETVWRAYRKRKNIK